jgi:hypothetical protein
LIGLLKCLRVPDSARTHGVVGGTILLTLLSFAGFAVTSLPLLRELFEMPQIPKEVYVYTERTIVYLALLCLVWFIVFLAQASQPLGSGKVLGETALSAFLIVAVVLGVKIVNDYYPLNSTSPKWNREKADETHVVETALYGIIWLLIAYSLMSVAGAVRRAINRWMEDNQDTLGLATE